jgi:PilZ domain
MRGESRRASRVRLEHKYPVNLMGVDGTWRRSCFLLDVSATGAKLDVEGSIDVLRAREFFLLLSSTGLAFRRCELVWIDGTQAGVRFIKARSASTKKSDRSEKAI